MKTLAALALSGCSLIAIHDPEPPACHRYLPLVDTALAGVVLAAGVERYNSQTQTSPWPLASVVAGAWAIASAAYGYHEVARCESVARDRGR
jgi:hypothetical protein